MDSKKIHILLADDEESVHATLGEFLVDCGHYVSGAWSEEEVVNLVNAADFDVVILGTEMLEAYNLEIVGWIRERSPGTAVVMTSRHGDTNTVIGALRAGASDFLWKPVSLVALKNTLDGVSRGELPRSPGASQEGTASAS